MKCNKATVADAVVAATAACVRVQIRGRPAGRDPWTIYGAIWLLASQRCTHATFIQVSRVLQLLV
eukprot:5815154-Pleurochrysis_carterae.AAC.1